MRYPAFLQRIADRADVQPVRILDLLHKWAGGERSRRWETILSVAREKWGSQFRHHGRLREWVVVNQGLAGFVS